MKRELRAVRESLLARHPAFHENAPSYLALLEALPARSAEWELAREMLHKAAGPSYPGKTHELRSLAGKLERMLEEGEDG